MDGMKGSGGVIETRRYINLISDETSFSNLSYVVLNEVKSSAAAVRLALHVSLHSTDV